MKLTRKNKISTNWIIAVWCNLSGHFDSIFCLLKLSIESMVHDLLLASLEQLKGTWGEQNTIA